MNRRQLQLLSLLALLFVFAAACGQKPGVSEKVEGVAAGGVAGGSLQLPEGTELDAEGNLVDTETGEIIATAEEVAANNPGLAAGGTTSGGTTSGGTTGETGGGETGGGETGGGETGGGETGGGGSSNRTGGDTTGVTDDVIKIGIHAPITGAAPVPSQSFDKGKDLYWNWLESQNIKINGRRVEVVFRNDNYNPSQAVTACREMVEDEHVFLLIGAAGADQILACARYAASVGVPYLSGGVTQNGLDGLPGYFALWMSYAQQGPLLADYLVTKAGAGSEKNGMIYFNSPAFTDANSEWVDAMTSKGASVDYNRAISKNSGTADAQTYATDLRTAGIENVYVLTSPTFFIQLAQAAQNQGYHPHYVGVGLSMALDTVANVACRNNQSIGGAHFLNPYPSYFDSNKFDTDFRKAGGTDDIMFGLWGVSKVLHKQLSLPGRDLSRERFVYALERAKIETGIAPPTSYSPSNHFGGSSMHLQRADCANNRWVTEQSFVSNF